MTSPGEMMGILHAPYPDSFRVCLRWASLEMLKDLYDENPDHPKVHEAQLALKAALLEWDDQAVADFLLNHLFEPPQSTDLQAKPANELRQVLASVYSYLFE
jgi:hypothetical protein